jgi:hypothetical protein
VEEQVEVGGSQKRSDLTVLTATGEVRLAGELRLPVAGPRRATARPRVDEPLG